MAQVECPKCGKTYGVGDLTVSVGLRNTVLVVVGISSVVAAAALALAEEKEGPLEGWKTLAGNWEATEKAVRVAEGTIEWIGTPKKGFALQFQVTVDAWQPASSPGATGVAVFWYPKDEENSGFQKRIRYGLLLSEYGGALILRKDGRQSEIGKIGGRIPAGQATAVQLEATGKGIRCRIGKHSRAIASPQPETEFVRVNVGANVSSATFSKVRIRAR